MTTLENWLKRAAPAAEVSTDHHQPSTTTTATRDGSQSKRPRTSAQGSTTTSSSPATHHLDATSHILLYTNYEPAANLTMDHLLDHLKESKRWSRPYNGR